MARFSEVLTIINGRNQKQVENPNGKYPIYASGGIMGYADDFICDGETVIIGRKGSINKPIFVDRPFWNVDTAFGLSAKRDVLLPKYLYYFCEVFDFERLNTTVTIPSLTKANLLNIKIKLPTLEEQQQIITLLDKLSDLIFLRKQQLAKLDELVKSRFVEMFGDPVHNTKMLPLKSLSDLGILDRGRSKHRPRNAPELLGGPYPLIQTGEVTNAGLYITSFQNTYSELGLQQSKMWNAGTLCITIAANIAQTAILAIDACFPDSVVGFVPHKEITAVYMHYWFGFFQKILEEQAPQVAQKNINLQILSDLKVMVPSMENQQEFLTFVEWVEKSKLTIQQSLDKLEMLKKSLMQEYFG